MKLIILLVVVCLGVSCLGLKPSKTSRPPPRGGPPRGGPQRGGPPKRSDSSKGWGWSDHLQYEKPPSCLLPGQVPVLGDGDIDIDFMSRQRLWYLAGSTKYGLNTYYRIFNARYAKTQQEIDEMCPTLIFSLESPIINSGSGVQFTQDCNSTISQSCSMNMDPATYDPPVDIYVALENQASYMIDTDSSTYIIYYVCNDYTYGDLQLVTTRPFASPALMKRFLSYFPRFNIKISQAQASICSAPKFNTPYPSPFENYPLSSGNNGWGSPPVDNGWGSPPVDNGWGSPPVDNGWSSPPVDNGWSSPPVDNGWSSPPLDNGWGSPVQSNGWGSPGGWGSNNGWNEFPKKAVEDKKVQEVKAEFIAEEVKPEVAEEVKPEVAEEVKPEVAAEAAQ